MQILGPLRSWFLPNLDAKMALPRSSNIIPKTPDSSQIIAMRCQCPSHPPLFSIFLFRLVSNSKIPSQDVSQSAQKKRHHMKNIMIRPSAPKGPYCFSMSSQLMRTAARRYFLLSSRSRALRSPIRSRLSPRYSRSSMFLVMTLVTSRNSSAVDAYRDLQLKTLYTRQAEQVFSYSASGVDIVIVPTAHTHWKIEEVLNDHIGKNSVLGEFTHFANVLDLCAVAVPAGTYPLSELSGNAEEEGVLPFSVTFLGGSRLDAEMLEIARRFEEGIKTV